ncbi:MAG: enoyl-CoA hydratase/isomerase family protein [Caulobacteraceae bacterium]|nr:enoyl-CoA hydratase/isomerase family protein [Caulobacteraceae bacterium]
MDDYSIFPALKVEREGENGEIFVVSINRPERLNAVDPETHRQIGRIWHMLDRDADCRVIVITGEGRAFCVGMDHKARGPSGDAGPPRYRSLRGRPGASKLIDNMLEVEKPIIAMINGPAMGMGLIIALTSDITVAASDATLGDTHINIGVTPGDGGVLLLPMLVGMNRAKELLMTGDVITGEEAARLGVVNHAKPREELRPFTLALAAKLAAKAPYAMRTTKVSLNMIMRRRALDVLDLSHLYEQLTMRTEDHREGVRAMAEKRQPKFVGR